MSVCVCSIILIHISAALVPCNLCELIAKQVIILERKVVVIRLHILLGSLIYSNTVFLEIGTFIFIIQICENN